MLQQKGFSLLEVLISLLLTSTLIYFLVQEQITLQHLFHQLQLRDGASQLLDQMDEYLLIDFKALPIAPLPYHFQLKQVKKDLYLQLDWSDKAGLMTRNYQQLDNTNE